MDKRLLDEDAVMQICFVTHDVQKSTKWFSELTGKPLPEEGRAADADEAQAVYDGKPAKVGCRIMMFAFGNIDVEFLEPGPEKSAWRDLLESRGPGCHHIAFRTRNLTRRNAYLEGQGHRLLQRGEFDGGHGRYAYYDTVADLGAMIELLEFDNDKEQQS
ncbi:VOC family protein [Roseibium marinum]|uniref:Glyoxalase/bleomycin resistance protein/dioxygenase superfamily protein n=1 Tax=Roseibium marinum TaxID=281252 RepID=A0A2S3URB5_9HYPH|nr:VOC family protein [Roseibium marinum]POF30029.1 glyoxalase/bleomycin resistance protein/dioxygenase superfamily protein [Roseibium marinum]